MQFRYECIPDVTLYPHIDTYAVSSFLFGRNQMRLFTMRWRHIS